MSAAQMQTPGGNRASAEETKQTSAIIGHDRGADKPSEKEINHAIAHLALNRHTVHRCKAGDYIVSKWGMSRYCSDGAELLAFARQLGVLQ